MSGLYSIPISGLKEGNHSFDFEINNEFFEKFEESEVKKGALKAIVEAYKRSSHIDLVITIKGVIMISCDRCLGEYCQPINCENRLLVKFGKTLDESDPDLITVPADESELDMQQYFYEFILLALPIKRVHPDNKTGKSTCDPEMLEMLKEHIVSDENEIDPRWDELKKLMNNN
jgi:uncharacterized metal-binding protein YceD (DUF177 family)